jgi:hypothetical protein
MRLLRNFNVIYGIVFLFFSRLMAQLSKPRSKVSANFIQHLKNRRHIFDDSDFLSVSLVYVRPLKKVERWIVVWLHF